MTYSIYHFFKTLVDKKDKFKTIKFLEGFPFEKKLIACRNLGVFPDLAIKLNKDKKVFTGGELIELKDSKTYTVSSFNSTIPTRKKDISHIITGEGSNIKQQMIAAGDDINSLQIRDVYYLVRGKKKDKIKVCLVFGSFFETITVENLIGLSFLQVLDEKLAEDKTEISEDVKATLLKLLSQQNNFSRVRNIDKASVKLRFRIMTEVKAEGNILNSSKYPEIIDNTLNLIIPCHNDQDEKNVKDKFEMVFGMSLLKQFNILKIKHHFNGYFLVFQTTL